MRNFTTVLLYTILIQIGLSANVTHANNRSICLRDNLNSFLSKLFGTKKTNQANVTVTLREGGPLPRIEICRTGDCAEPENIIAYARTDRGLGGTDPFRNVASYYDKEMLNLETLKNQKVLDAGTGDGNFVTDLRAKGVDAVGQDIYLNQNQKNMQGLFFQSDMAHMPFRDHEFDVIYSTWSAVTYEGNNQKLMRNIFKEFSRVLSPNGKIRISPLNMSTADFNEVLKPAIESVLHLKVTKVITMTNPDINLGREFLAIEVSHAK